MKLKIEKIDTNMGSIYRPPSPTDRAHKSSIDVILTNKSKSFQHSPTCETGLSDHHHMISTFLKTHLFRLKPKRIT